MCISSITVYYPMRFRCKLCFFEVFQRIIWLFKDLSSYSLLWKIWTPSWCKHPWTNNFFCLNFTYLSNFIPCFYFKWYTCFSLSNQFWFNLVWCPKWIKSTLRLRLLSFLSIIIVCYISCRRYFINNVYNRCNIFTVKILN